MHFIDERFWLALSFLIFIYLAYKPIKKAILNSLDAKIDTIKTRLTEAENLKKEAKLLLEKTEIQMNQLTILHQEMLHDAKIQTNQMIEEGTSEIETLLQRKRTEAVNAIERQKLQACSKIQSEFSDKVIKTVTEYFKLSENESLPDTEIAKNLINKNNPPQ
jgi:F-type H+-transporting ATPase subunit b